MLPVTSQAEKTIVDALLKHFPKALCHGLEEGLVASGARAYRDSAQRHEGHLPSVLGQARHFHSNEQFALALDMAGVAHNQLRGNDIIIGELGPLLIGRFCTHHCKWNNAKRSKRRLDVASHNQWLERMVQPGLFGEHAKGPQIAVFLVSVYSSDVRIQPELPLSVEIAVLDTTLSERLFSEPLTSFLGRYAQPADQQDIARVRLKTVVKKQQDSQP